MSASESKAKYIARRKEEERLKKLPIVDVCEVIHKVNSYTTVLINNTRLLVIQTAQGEIIYALAADGNAFDYVFDSSNYLMFVSSACKRVMITIDVIKED